MSLSKQALSGMIGGAIIVAALFFFIGYSVGHAHPAARGTSARTGRTGAGSFNGAAGGAGMAQGGMRGGFSNGMILAMTDSSITLSLQNSGSQTVYFTTATPVMKNVSGAISDLKVGDMVTVTGTSNADGSLAANSVSIRPAGTGMTNKAQVVPASAPTEPQ